MILTNLTSRLLNWVNWIMFTSIDAISLLPLPWTMYLNHPPVKTTTGILHGGCGQESPCTRQFTLLTTRWWFKNKENVRKKHSYSESPSSNSKLAELSLPGQTARAIIVEDGEQGSLGSSWWQCSLSKERNTKKNATAQTFCFGWFGLDGVENWEALLVASIIAPGLTNDPQSGVSSSHRIPR